MNNKEKAVLYFLCISFIVGASISFMRHKREQQNLEAITIKKAINDTIIQAETDSIDNEETDSLYETALININTALNKELEALPGIGPALSKRIIDYRQKHGGFKTKNEIKKVSGIGPKKFAAIEHKITTTP